MKTNNAWFLGLCFLGLITTSCAFQKQLVPLSHMNELQYPFPTQTIQLQDDIQLAYMDEGPKNGHILILIHGLGSYAPAWKKNMEALKQNYRCIAIDLPGFGKSSKGNYEGSMRFYADIVIQFMDAMSIPSATLFGHSMGGQISMTASLAYPDRVDRLVLVSPAGFETFHEGQKEWFREVISPTGVRLTSVEQIKSNLAHNFYDFPKDAQFMIEDRINMRSASDFEGYCFANAQSVKGMVDGPVFDYLPEIQAQTLVIFGAQDNLIPNRFLNPGSTQKVAESGAERIPNASLHLIDKAGHFVHFEQAGIVNPIIESFLQSK